MPTLRIYPFECLDGPDNMARDERLLDLATRGQASLRFYEWSTPTLSLGYFQPAAEREIPPAIAALPWLRRASGGAAILHGDGDLTYALAFPPGPPWQSTDSWVCRFHYLIQDEINRIGKQAKMVVCGEEQRLGPTLCFLDHTPGDVVLQGTKVVGSAQRKSRGALLQHGTIRWKTSTILPELTGFAGDANLPNKARDLARELQNRLIAKMNWDAETADWSADDLAFAHQIANEKYRSAEWNNKR